MCLRHLFLPLFAGLLFHTASSFGEHNPNLYFIDAHSQAESFEVLELVIPAMDRAGVRHTILSGRRQLASTDIAAFAEKHSGRITPAVRTKGGPYRKNSRKYFTNLDHDVGSGQFGGIAELLLYHAQKDETADEVTVYPDDHRVLQALAAAKSKGWPLVLHIEFASLPGGERAVFMRKLETLLADNADQPFVMIHMAQLQAVEVQRLITTHKNIHFMTSHTSPVTIRGSEQPWTRMFDGDALKAEWAKLVTQYPDRFVFAMDNVWADHWGDYYVDGVQYWRKAVAGLPAPVAHAVAHGNAERLWKIKNQ